MMEGLRAVAKPIYRVRAHVGVQGNRTIDASNVKAGYFVDEFTLAKRYIDKIMRPMFRTIRSHAKHSLQVSKHMPLLRFDFSQR
jgi:hypothetical protein